MSMTLIQNARVILPTAVRNTQVLLADGKIAAIADRMDAPSDAQVVDGEGMYLSPGFVDIHVHGGGGREIMECDPQAVAVMSRAHLMHGTTAILPTLSAAPMQTTFRAIDAAREAIEGGMAPNAVGIHLEGPFMSPLQAGAQLPENLLIPANEDYEALLDRWNGIRMIGAAPELAGALDLGRAAQKRGIVASIAHSNATYEEVEAAVLNGYRDVTHLYSGCSTIVRRDGFRVPGVVEAGMLIDSLTVQLIADLCHLPAELLKLVYKTCGVDRISLITDALPFAGCELEEGKIYVQANGQEVLYEDGVMKMPDHTCFCGSAATTDRLVRNMLSIGFSPVDTIRMAAQNPARVIGLGDTKGRISVGYDADVLLFTDDVQVRKIWLKGDVVL